ncbi:MAG: hypothetical protein ACYC4Q_08580 [Victivallaceae bacterium]
MKRSLILFTLIAIAAGTITAFATDKTAAPKTEAADPAATPAATTAPATEATDATQKKEPSLCPKCGRKALKKFFFEPTPGDKIYCCSSFCVEKLRREHAKAQKKSNGENANSTTAKQTDKKKNKTAQ